jgi:hypothetical protein
MLRFRSTLLGVLASCFAGCGSGDSSETPAAADLFNPVPVESLVILEVESGTSLTKLAAEVPEYQARYVNTVSVSVPGPAEIKSFKTLIDTCHRYGLNVFLRTDRPKDVRLSWVLNQDVDGFVCGNVATRTQESWNAVIDSMQQFKAVVMIANEASEAMKDAGFAAGYDNEFANALVNSSSEHGVAGIDSVLRRNETMFSEFFLPVRRVPANLADAALEPASLLTFTTKAIPSLTTAQMEKHRATLQPMLDAYAESPLLQYGTFERYDGENPDVVTYFREYQDRKTLFAINLRDRTAPYTWPLTFYGLSRTVTMGEPITRNGGQPLPPYGFQVIAFDKPLRSS